MVSLYTEILQCVLSKNKYILLYNHSWILKIRTFNNDTILLFNPQPIVKLNFITNFLYQEWLKQNFMKKYKKIKKLLNIKKKKQKNLFSWGKK